MRPGFSYRLASLSMLIGLLCKGYVFSAQSPVAPKPTVDVRAIDRERILKAAQAALAMEAVTITRFRAKLSEGGPNDFGC